MSYSSYIYIALYCYNMAVLSYIPRKHSVPLFWCVTKCTIFGVTTESCGEGNLQEMVTSSSCGPLTYRQPTRSRYHDVASGKRLHNYGKSPFKMAKPTISMAIFNSKPLVYQRVPYIFPPSKSHCSSYDPGPPVAMVVGSPSSSSRRCVSQQPERSEGTGQDQSKGKSLGAWCGPHGSDL